MNVTGPESGRYHAVTNQQPLLHRGPGGASLTVSSSSNTITLTCVP